MAPKAPKFTPVTFSRGGRTAVAHNATTAVSLEFEGWKRIDSPSTPAASPSEAPKPVKPSDK